MVSEHLLGGNTEALQWEASRHHVSLQPRLCLFGLWVVQTQGCMFFSHCETVIWTAIRHLENRVLGPHMLLDWSRLRKPSSLNCVIYALCVLRLTSIFFHAWENKAVFCPCIQSNVSFYFVSILRIHCLACTYLWWSDIHEGYTLDIMTRVPLPLVYFLLLFPLFCARNQT